MSTCKSHINNTSLIRLNRPFLEKCRYCWTLVGFTVKVLIIKKTLLYKRKLKLFLEGHGDITVNISFKKIKWM